MVLFQQCMLHRWIVLDCSAQDSNTPFFTELLYLQIYLLKIHLLTCLFTSFIPQYRHNLIIAVVCGFFLQDILTKCFYVDMYLFLPLKRPFNILQFHACWKDICILYYRSFNTKYDFAYRKIIAYVLGIIFWHVLCFLIPNDHRKI